MSSDIVTFIVIVVLGALTVLSAASNNPFMAVMCLILACGYLAWSCQRWQKRMKDDGRW